MGQHHVLQSNTFQIFVAFENSDIKPADAHRELLLPPESFHNNSQQKMILMCRVSNARSMPMHQELELVT